MEFLDSDSKRKRTLKLFLGYFLIAICIGLATLLLVYLAQGYNYDLDKGVVRNGLVFIESKPVPANIFIDNEAKDKTGARLELSEGQHSILLKQAKYRDWSKTFSLEGGSVQYFIYPKLIPIDIPVGVNRVFSSAPVWASQSPDRRWLVLQEKAITPLLTLIDLSKPDTEPTLLTLSNDQLSVVGSDHGTISPVEWSDDNRHLLLSQKFADGSLSYIIFDRENSDLSLNLSKTLNLNPTVKLSLIDKKYDKYYVFDVDKTLKKADLKNGLTALPIIVGVETFKSFSDDRILFVTYENASQNLADVYILNDESERFRLKSLVRDPSNRYLLDLAEFKNDWYYVTASVSDKKFQLYRNPMKRAKAGNTEAISPQMSLALNNPQYISFSSNARFIAAQNGDNFVVFDGEQNRVYRFTLGQNIPPGLQAKWADGHRLSVVANKKILLFEFDGENRQELIAGLEEFGAYFDRDYDYVYSLILQADGKTAFESGQLVVD